LAESVLSSSLMTQKAILPLYRKAINDISNTILTEGKIGYFGIFYNWSAFPSANEISDITSHTMCSTTQT